MKIIKYHKVGKDKYKILFDNKEELIILQDVIIKNELLLKKEIDIKLYNKIIKDNLTATIYNSCLNLISTRIRSTNEIKEYLNKKEIDSSTQEQVINNLVAKGYLNDEIYTKCYITDKINLTNNGPYKIISELKKQKIEDELINKYLYNEENNILFAEKIKKIINKSIKNNKKYSGNLLRRKIYYYLINLGYDQSMISRLIDEYNFTNTDNIKNVYQKLTNKYQKKYPVDKLPYIIKEKLLAKGYTIDEINSININ